METMRVLLLILLSPKISFGVVVVVVVTIIQVAAGTTTAMAGCVDKTKINNTNTNQGSSAFFLQISLQN